MWQNTKKIIYYTDNKIENDQKYNLNVMAKMDKKF